MLFINNSFQYNTFVKCFLLLFFTTSISCTNQTADKPKPIKKEQKLSVQKKVKKVKKKKTTEESKLVRLSNKNLVSYLTKFEKKNKERKIRIITDKGDIDIRLYPETKLHRANFVKLIKDNYYTNTVFYRVTPNFVIQGADNDTDEHLKIKNAIGYYSIPSEFMTQKYYHKRGAVSMARSYENNPEKRSSYEDFFIIVGTKYTNKELNALERELGKKYTSQQRKDYTTIGGAAHLDNEHTVFGEVIKGMDIADKISKVETDGSDWPKKDIYIKKIIFID